MTDEQARKLAIRIIDTWPNSAKAYVWRDTLLGLDQHTADVTYRTLCANATSAPTPGLFLITYRAERSRLTAAVQPVLELVPIDAISRDEYLERLQRRATHDARAADELKLKLWTHAHQLDTAVQLFDHELVDEARASVALDGDTHCDLDAPETEPTAEPTDEEQP